MSTRSYRSIGLYAVAILLVSASNFAITPLLLRQIGAEEFAIWALLEPLILLAIPLAGLGINIGYMRAHDSMPNIQGKLFPIHSGCVVAFAIVSAIFMLLSGVKFNLVIMAMFIIIPEAIITFLVAYWRSANRPISYAFFEGGRALIVVLLISASVLLYASFPSTTYDYMSIRAAIGVMFALAGYLTLRWRLAPDWAESKRAVRYGLPIVLSSVAVAVVMNFDRYGVSAVAGDASLAGYVAHVKVVQILGSALAPFFTWFAPAAIRHLRNQGDDGAFFRGSFYGFVSVNLALSLGLWLITPLLWPYLFPGVPFDAALFAVNIVAMSIFACGNPLSIGTLIEGRTRMALFFTSLAGVVGLVAVTILAPIYGVMGVAAGKALALLVYTSLFAADTLRHVPVRYNWGIIGLLVVITINAAVGIGWAVPPESFFPRLMTALITPLALLVLSYIVFKLRIQP